MFDDANAGPAESAVAETGMSAPSAGSPQADVVSEAGAFAPQTGAVPEIARTSSITAAPTRFSKAAQQAWIHTPEPVRDDAARAIAELTSGLEKYRADAAGFAAVRAFDEIARQSGTTLAEALEGYYGIEQHLQKDFVSGIALICRNMGVDPRELGVALSRAPVQQQMQRQQPIPRAPQPPPESDTHPLFRAHQAQALLHRFALARDERGALMHPHFAELEPSIAHMLATGFAQSLPEAYDKAVRLNPEIAARIEAGRRPATEARPEAAQTRGKAGLSITGAPSSASNVPTRKPAGSPREAVLNAMAQIGLR